MAAFASDLPPDIYDFPLHRGPTLSSTQVNRFQCVRVEPGSSDLIDRLRTLYAQ